MSGLLYKSTSLAYFCLLAAFQKKQQQQKKWQMPILEGELDNLELIEL